MLHHLIINILQADWYLIAPFFIAEETEVQINFTNHRAKEKARIQTQAPPIPWVLKYLASNSVPKNSEY